MKDHIKATDNFLDISAEGNVVISFDESRATLAKIGIAGEILPTPGHSPDSVSLLLDDGSVFTGDLTHPSLVTDEDEQTVTASWNLLRDRGALRVYGGHGPIRGMPEI